MITSYQVSAKQSTTFVAINELSCHHRRTKDVTSLLWSLGVSRQSMPDEFSTNVAHQMLTIDTKCFSSYPTGRCARASETIHVAIESFSKADTPPAFHPLFDKHILPQTLSVGLGFHLSDDLKLVPSRLFSFMPLPIETSLPTHLHASFIMADDRRTIRFDDGCDPASESAYNRWLLSSHIPQLYLSLLHHWPTSGPVRIHHLWPSTIGKDPYSRLVAHSLYVLTGDESQRRVCETVSGHRVAPTSAILLEASPAPGSELAGVLELLSPEDLVTRPVYLIDTSMRRVDHSYVRDTVHALQAIFVKLFNEGKILPEHVESVVRYLLQDTKGRGPALLQDLPLLPLGDGTLSTLGKMDRSSSTICWNVGSVSTVDPSRVFSPARFVASTVNSSYQTTLLSLDVGLVILDDEIIADLVCQRIAEGDDRILTNEDSVWIISQFWPTFDALHSTKPLTAKFCALPLVPVASLENRFVSIAKCRGASVFLTPEPEDRWIVDSLGHIGALQVERDALPLPLQHRLEFLQFSIHTVLDFLALPDTSLADCFARMSNEESSQMCSWLRQQLSDLPSNRPVHHSAHLLPIWPARHISDGLPHDILSTADTIEMLPLGIPLDDAEMFLTAGKYSTFDPVLRTVLGVQPMNISAFRNRLSMQPGSIIPPRDLGAFGRLLTTIIRSSIADNKPILVPNASGVLTPTSSLYALSEPLFSAAFATRRPEVFIHTALVDREASLGSFGLHTTVDFEAFKACVTAIHDADDSDTSREQSASEVFEFYHQRLTWDPHTRWEEVDFLQFIPRAAARRRDMPEFDGYSRSLPNIVSPSQLLRPEYERVAWTQRGLFKSAPADSDRLLFEHKTLGIPTAKEVVRLFYITWNSRDFC